jgi:hypothetical protein
VLRQRACWPGFGQRRGGAGPGQAARGNGGVAAWGLTEEEEGWGGKRRKEKEKEKEKRKRKKRKKRNRKRKRNRKMEKEIGKCFREIRRISQEIRGRVFAGFSGFSGVGVIFGTAVMARRTGRRDRGVRGIPGVVADRGAGATRNGRRPERRRCWRDSRHARRRERNRSGFRKGVNELSWKVLKTRVIY